MCKISPSVLACDFSHLADEVKSVETGGAEYLHLDVMDGVFVPNISFGPCVIHSIRAQSAMVFDVHLMITDPIRYVGAFADAGADIITIHYESCDDPAAVLREIHRLGKKAAISIKPATPASVLKPFLPDLDMILVMTVEPGFGGQSFMPETMASVRAVRQMIEESGRVIELEVDGGINAQTVITASEAGADVFVAGSSVFRASDRGEAIRNLRHAAESVK